MILSANPLPSHWHVRTFIQTNRTDGASSVLTSSRRRSLCCNSTPAASRRRQQENRPTQARMEHLLRRRRSDLSTESSPSRSKRIAETKTYELVFNGKRPRNKPRTTDETIFSIALCSPGCRSEDRRGGGAGQTSRTHSRSELISVWARVGELCRLAGDETSWRAIFAALCSRPIACLDKAWKRVNPQALAVIESWAHMPARRRVLHS